MLVGDNGILRTVRAPDLDTLFELTADVCDAGGHGPLQPHSEYAARKRSEENGWWGEEFGYRTFKPDDRGKGHMPEAGSLAVAFSFATKTIDRIQATTRLGNEASERVLEKCGFALEGIMRKAMFHHGRSEDLRLASGDRPPACSDSSHLLRMSRVRARPG
jgi:hypothetical protein